MRAVVLVGSFPATARAQDLGQGPAPLPAAAPDKPVLTEAPAVVKALEPVYPPEALAQPDAAAVTMVVDLDATGTVTAVDVPRPVRHHRHRPAPSGDGQVPVWVIVRDERAGTSWDSRTFSTTP